MALQYGVRVSWWHGRLACTELWVLSPALHTFGMVGDTCNDNPGEVEAGGSGVKDHLMTVE